MPLTADSLSLDATECTKFEFDSAPLQGTPVTVGADFTDAVHGSDRRQCGHGSDRRQCVFYYCRTYYNLFAWGEEESGKLQLRPGAAVEDGGGAAEGAGDDHAISRTWHNRCCPGHDKWTRA